MNGYWGHTLKAGGFGLKVQIFKVQIFPGGHCMSYVDKLCLSTFSQYIELSFWAVLYPCNTHFRMIQKSQATIWALQGQRGILL